MAAVSYVTVDDSGNRDYPLGEDAAGLILYTPQGWMSAQLMRRDRCATLSPPWKQASATESRRADRQVDSGG